MGRVIIGDDYPSSSQGISDALAAGHRWLVFKDTNIPLSFGINLDNYASAAQLRLEGGGVNLTHLIRQFTNAPMLYAFNSLWRIHMTGIHFDGQNANYYSTWPCCEFRSIQLSYFEDCAFSNSGGSGMSLGLNNQADTVRMMACRFEFNGVQETVQPPYPILNGGADGLTIFNGIDITMIGCAFQRNPSAGLQWLGPSNTTRGLGTILGCHFEQNGMRSDNPRQWGIYLNSVRQVRVVNSYLYDSFVMLTNSTSNCIIEQNSFYFASGLNPVTDQGSGNLIRENISDIPS